MNERSELYPFKWSSILLSSISLLLLFLRLFDKQFFQLDFELFLFHIPAILSVIVYVYLFIRSRFS